MRIVDLNKNRQYTKLDLLVSPEEAKAFLPLLARACDLPPGPGSRTVVQDLGSPESRSAYRPRRLVIYKYDDEVDPEKEWTAQYQALLRDSGCTLTEVRLGEPLSPGSD